MIICAGEALIDMIPGRTDAKEEAFVPHAGGSVYNTAIALGRLGAQVGYLGGLSKDFFGDMLVRGLNESGVASQHSPRLDHPSTLAFVHLVDGQAEYAFYDDGTAGRMLSEDHMPALPDEVEAVFFGGISLVNDPSASAYEALMSREKDTRVVMLDPNIRAAFIKDEDGYRERLARLIAMSDIIKLSDEDLTWVFGPGHISERAGQILALGPKLVFITEGGSGARAYTAEHEVKLHAEKVDVIDTVGAGDTFNAGVLSELQRAGLLNKVGLHTLSQGAIEAALSLAIRVAAVTVSRAGANPPWSDEI